MIREFVTNLLFFSLSVGGFSRPVALRETHQVLYTAAYLVISQKQGTEHVSFSETASKTADLILHKVQSGHAGGAGGFTSARALFG